MGMHAHAHSSQPVTTSDHDIDVHTARAYVAAAHRRRGIATRITRETRPPGARGDVRLHTDEGEKSVALQWS